MAIAQSRRASQLHGRTELAQRLEARRAEIEQAATARIHAIDDPRASADPEYAEGLRAAVSAALDYAIAVVERGEERAPALPPVLLVQARLAARNGVSLDTVLRRYFAGYTLMGDFLMREAKEAGTLQSAALQDVMRAQAALFDRLVAAVSEEYGRESRQRPSSAERRRAERVEKLLAGELVDVSEIQYDFEAHHLGLIAHGPGASETIGGLTAALDCNLLSVRFDDSTVWAWLGGRRKADPESLARAVSENLPFQVSLALGEPTQGLGGWRLTHHQARAALPVAQRGARGFARYASVALLASMLQDELLTTSLREIYLKPLESEKNGGKVLRETLRAYFAADRNVSSAAAALKVSRRTVANRLHQVEARLGQPLGPVTAEIETALRLHDLLSSRISTLPFSHW